MSIGEEILEIFGAKLGDWLLILPALALDSPCWVKLVDSKEVVALTPPPWQRKEKMCNSSNSIVVFFQICGPRAHMFC